MFKSSSADLAKLKKLMIIFLQMPQMQLQDAMELAKNSNKEIADVAFCCFLQRALPGISLKELRAYVAGKVAPLPAQSDSSEQCQHRTINDDIERTPFVDHAINHMAGAPATGSTPPAFSTEPNPDEV
jgi:hypothetical protein